MVRAVKDKHPAVSDKFKRRTMEFVLTETKKCPLCLFFCVKTSWNSNNYCIIVTCKKCFQDVQ